MAADREQFLETMARKYLWWRSVDGRAFDEGRIIAQVLDIGTFEDATDLLKTVGEERVRDVLVTSEPGWFSPRSWAYWNYRLGIIPFGERVPPLPRRRLSR